MLRMVCFLDYCNSHVRCRLVTHSFLFNTLVAVYLIIVGSAFQTETSRCLSLREINTVINRRSPPSLPGSTVFSKSLSDLLSCVLTDNGTVLKHCCQTFSLTPVIR